MPEQQRPTAFLNLVEVIKRLRAPDGCPWDREQTAASLKPYLLEETYEVLEALDHGDPEAICEELGDLLLQVVFYARIFEEQGQFTVEDAARGITDKLIRRHPHVFADTNYSSMEELDRQWERIKGAEKKNRKPSRPQSRIPKALPALARAQKIAAGRYAEGLAQAAQALQGLGDPQQIHPDRREKYLAQALYDLVVLGHNWELDCEQVLRRFMDVLERNPEPRDAKADGD